VITKAFMYFLCFLCGTFATKCIASPTTLFSQRQLPNATHTVFIAL